MTDLSAARTCRAASLCIALASLPLVGCLQTLPQPVCPPSVQAAQSSLRAMVSFRQPVNGEAAATLQQLQSRAGVCATYLSSVSPSVHVYEFQGVRDPAALTQSLRAWPLVQDVVPDARARAQ
jgi:hypothetical protein